IVKGRVDWSSNSASDSTAPVLHPALTVIASNVQLDSDLMAAIPPVQAKWLDRLGAKGVFDLNGTVSNNAKRAMEFVFDVTPHDCSLWPVDDAYAITAVNGSLKLTPQKLTLVDLHGTRGDADVTAHGEVSWPSSPPQMSIVAEARNLALDQTLFDLIPEMAQKGWTQAAPEGTVDASITFSGAPSNDAVASAVDVAPSSQPAGQNFVLTLTPRHLSITPHAAPYRLEELSGVITVTPSTVKLQNVAGHHGSAEIHLSGTGATDPNGVWDMQINGSKMLVDKDLLKGVPPGLQSVLRNSQMQGTIAFELSHLKIWTDAAPTTAPAVDAKADTSGSGSPQPPATAASTTDADFTLKLAANDASLNPGVPLSKLSGVANFNGSTRLGVLTDLSGDFEVPSVEIAGRPATNVRAELLKRPGQDAMKLAKIQAQLVGGQLAGQIDWTYPDNGPSRYAMALVLHNADVKTLTGDIMPDAHGSLSASLSMEGNLNDPTSRRGGGDVALSGEQLYKMPLILGLLQVTSLSLPITSPFNEGTCKYTIDGMRVTFESIELRAKEMMVSGNGHLDFDTGRVGLSFTSQSDISWLKVPVVNDLLQGARNELLRIHVRGTIQEPQVSTSSMNTFVTTVDEIFKGGNPPPDLPPVKKPKKGKGS
ncbi:MAG TPA: AsmA-like C-terminal region-containing protein, partial [Tepidisphaeraceae bacterium]|nr:AsmA-like C-terminal region-containing protein [Tepidisphaeraceae bacterium]